jgi:hypothetical protein
MRHDDPGPPRGFDERSEQPFIQGTIAATIERAAMLLRAALGAIPQRVLIAIWALGSLAVFLLIAISTIVTTPTGTGVLQGFFGGLFIALLCAAALGWMLLWARTSRDRSSATESSADGLDAALAPTLRELDALRRQIVEQVKTRSLTRVPIGMAGGILVWVLGRWSDDPGGPLELLMFFGLGAIAGETWALHAPSRTYRRHYKERVLPHLAASVGNLTYRPASPELVHQLGVARILPDYDTVEADDEIAGTHHGLAVQIVEASLRRRQEKKSHLVFDGLLVSITLPRRLTSTTVVLTDAGVWEKFKASWRGGVLEPVRLEHDEFERRYEVYSTDQIEARALLTPAFMERFVALAATTGFALPGALAEGPRLLVALPKRLGTGDLFEPPPYWKPAGGSALVRLQNDIRAVLAMADTVIALDFWASGRRHDASGREAGPARPSERADVAVFNPWKS